MNLPRFSIKSLMALVLGVAMVLGMLKVSSYPLASLVFTASCALAGQAIIGSAIRKGPDRAASLGFAVFACGYLWIAFGASKYPLPRLFTTQLALDIQWYASPHVDRRTIEFSSWSRTTDYLAYRMLSESCFAIVAGLTGAVLGRRAHRAVGVEPLTTEIDHPPRSPVTAP